VEGPWRQPSTAPPGPTPSSAPTAPAAVRIALPEANPTYYLTASLGVTFPFNLTIGIPLYYTMAQMMWGVG
jgi:hypothetical protein